MRAESIPSLASLKRGKALEKEDPSKSKYEPSATQASLVCADAHPAQSSTEHWPLASADAYYEHSSSHHMVLKVRKPLPAINSTDDPVVVHAPTSPEEVGSGWTIVALTDGGGHLGWFEPSSGLIRVGTDVSKLHLRRWMTKPALEWLKLAAEVLVEEDVGGDARVRLCALITI
ncbi:hypothetical protein D9757_001084 [Collybiopsis confluens]|uniref:Uncharacterized protein n=1 Tax=Collybiopsis confluens TaxID=2823264 RepID=A0A8H5I0U9_9AGAR|nr:hypothetical protein D9757_001084 [Collybiopsis confluens]